MKTTTDKLLQTPTQKTQKLFKKIKTIDDACKVLGIKKIKFEKVGRPSKRVRAYKHLCIIAEAIDKNTKLDVPRNN